MHLPIRGEQLLRLIPQRLPMVMVDTLFEYGEDYVKTGLEVSDDIIFVQQDLLQESGLLEHMAQSVALHTGYHFFLAGQEAPTGYIGSIQNVEMLRLPGTGQHISTDVQIVQEFMGVTLVNIVSSVDQQVIARAQMKTVVVST